MSDNDLITAVREDFTAVRMDTPAETIIARGRSLRRRRRVPGLAAGAAALGLSLGLGVPALAPGGTSVNATPAAWTVARGPSDTVVVTVRQLRDPGGLQRTLRADGVPVMVRFYPGADLNPPRPASCQAVRMSDEANARLQDKILLPGMSQTMLTVALGIRPAAIPKGIGLYLAVNSRPDGWGWGVDLVRASPACTGS